MYELLSIAGVKVNIEGEIKRRKYRDNIMKSIQNKLVGNMDVIGMQACFIILIDNLHKLNNSTQNH